MEKLTVVIPIRNEHLTLRGNMAKISAILSRDGIEADFMVVDDGSDDSTWYELRTITERSGNIFGIRLSRSFGRDAAILAGLEHAGSPFCLVMNSDLSHPPGAVKEMLKVMELYGADLVEAVPERGGDEKGGVYAFFSGLLRGIARAASGFDRWEGSDFRLMTRKVVLALRHFEEDTPSFRRLTDWSGFPVYRCEYAPDESEDNDKNAPAIPLAVIAGAALRAVLSRVGRPPLLAYVSALLCLAGATASGVAAIAIASEGREYGLSCLISVILALGALILAAMGVNGANISRLRNGIRRRPAYLISDKTGGVFNKP